MEKENKSHFQKEPKAYLLRHFLLASLAGFFIFSAILTGGFYYDLKIQNSTKVKGETREDSQPSIPLILPADGTIQVTQSANGSYLLSLSRDSVADHHIQDGAIEGDELARKSVHAYHLASGSITERMIEDGAIDTRHFDDTIRIRKYLRVGDGNPSHFTLGTGDAYISDNLEVDGDAYFDETIYVRDSSSISTMTSNTLQTTTANISNILSNSHLHIKGRLPDVDYLKIDDFVKAFFNPSAGTIVGADYDNIPTFQFIDGAGDLYVSDDLEVNGTIYGNISGAYSPSGDLDMDSNLITNIGNAGTDFTATGGLNLADGLTITGNITLSGTVDGKDIATYAAMLNEGEIITANWVNTANPWADNEVADNLTIIGGSIDSTTTIDKDPIITLSGDLSGNITLGNLSGGTLAALVMADSVTLATDTTGNYIATLAGNSQIEVSGSGSENAAVSLSINTDSIGDSQLAYDTGQHLTTASSPTFAGLTLSGNLVLGANTFTTDNTSLVSNLNADLLDGQHGSYYAPLANLSGTVGYLSKFTGDNSIGNSVIYESGGNVGIGTTGPGATLEVANGSLQLDDVHNDDGSYSGSTGLKIGRTYNLTGSSWINGNGDSVLLHNAYLEGSSSFKWTSTHNSFGSRGIQFSYNFDDGIRFYADRKASTAGASFTPTERMRIMNDGNVGIGTTAPTYKLHVNGTTGFESTIYAPNIGTGEDNSVLVLSSSGNLVTDEIDSRVWGSSLLDYSGTNTGYVPYFSDTDTLSQSGIYYDGTNVGIGTTGPGAKLEVNGEILSSNFNTNGSGVEIGSSTTSDEFMSIAIGDQSSVSTAGVAIGYSALSNNIFSIAIGRSAWATGSSSVAIGGYATEASGSYSIAIGASIANVGPIASGNSAIALGILSNASHDYSIAIGNRASTTGTYQLVIGGGGINYGIKDVYIGQGVVSSTPQKTTFNATGGSGTDITGGDLELAGGKGTGAGLGGSIIFKTAPAGATGETLGTLSERMRITSSGNVGIGTTVPAQKLQVAGRIRMDTWTADGDVAVYYNSSTGDIGVTASDERLKTNIETIPNALSIIKNIRGITFNWKDDSMSKDKSIGIIAQEALAVMPELTFPITGPDGKEYLGVHYDKISPILIEAVKEQQEQISNLQFTVSNEFSILNDSMTKLDSRLLGSETSAEDRIAVIGADLTELEDDFKELAGRAEGQEELFDSLTVTTAGLTESVATLTELYGDHETRIGALEEQVKVAGVSTELKLPVILEGWSDVLDSAAIEFDEEGNVKVKTLEAEKGKFNDFETEIGKMQIGKMKQVILESPSGACFKLEINDQGQIESEEVDCQAEMEE